jgi:hypothetical protein
MDKTTLIETIGLLEEQVLMYQAAGSFMAMHEADHKPPEFFTRKMFLLDNLIKYLKDQQAIKEIITPGDLN